MFKRKQQQDQVLLLNEEHDEIQVQAYFSPLSARGGYKKQYLFVNGRYLIDKSLHYFVINSMQNIWQNGQTGHYFIMISIPSDQIDVNIHPSKTQIKFEDDSIILSLLSKGIRSFAPEIEPQNSSQANFQTQGSLQSTNITHEDSSSLEQKNYPKQKSENQIIKGFKQNESDFESSVIDISIDYFVIKANQNESSPKVIDKTLFLKWFLPKFLNDSRYQSVPLIISDPLPNLGYSREALEFLADNYQIEIEILDSKVALLRSIPYCLTKLPYQIIIEQILAVYQAQSSINFEKIMYRQIMQSFYAHQFIGVLTDYEIKVAKTSFCIEINNELFHKM